MRKWIILRALDVSENIFWDFAWARKFTGGEWFLMRTALPMGDIWCRQKFKSCQAVCIGAEIYNWGVKKRDELTDEKARLKVAAAKKGTLLQK